MTILETRGLTKSFGGLSAVNDLDLVVNKGEIVGLIGPNGAGKTTAFNLISGYIKPTSGQIFFNGEDITNLKMDRIARKGLVRTFQHSTLFGPMTVMENMIVAMQMREHIPLLADLLKTKSSSLRWRQLREKSHDILETMGLSGMEDTLAESLPYGCQRLLGVAVALAVEPMVILLDEPVTGMNTQETKMMVDKLALFRERGITTLLVEHHMRVVMGLCDRVYVLNFGAKMAEGLPKDVSRNKDVIQAYLGARYVSGN